MKVAKAQPKDIVLRQGSNTSPASSSNNLDNPLYFYLSKDLYNVLAHFDIVCNRQPTDQDVLSIENIFLVKESQVLCTAKLPGQNLSL